MIMSYFKGTNRHTAMNSVITANGYHNTSICADVHKKAVLVTNITEITANNQIPCLCSNDPFTRWDTARNLLSGNFGMCCQHHSPPAFASSHASRIVWTASKIASTRKMILLAVSSLVPTTADDNWLLSAAWHAPVMPSTTATTRHALKSDRLRVTRKNIPLGAPTSVISSLHVSSGQHQRQPNYRHPSSPVKNQRIRRIHQPKEPCAVQDLVHDHQP
jgi:hypothetical protein